MADCEADSSKKSAFFARTVGSTYLSKMRCQPHSTGHLAADLLLSPTGSETIGVFPFIFRRQILGRSTHSNFQGMNLLN